MSRNLQNCYCDHESAERRAKLLTEQTGRLHLVYANALGYWEPRDVEDADDPVREHEEREARAAIAKAEGGDA